MVSKVTEAGRLRGGRGTRRLFHARTEFPRVVTGSSSGRRWHPTVQEDLTPLTIIPRGFGGSTMEDALYYIDRVAIAYQPRAVAIYEGDNDTGSYQVPPETIASQFEAIVAKIHATLPETRIYAFSVKPSVRRWLVWPEAEKANELLEALYERNDLLTYVDVATPMLDANGEVFQDIFVDDNLPLNEKGYKIDFVVGELGAGGGRALVSVHGSEFVRSAGARFARPRPLEFTSILCE